MTFRPNSAAYLMALVGALFLIQSSTGSIIAFAGILLSVMVCTCLQVRTSMSMAPSSTIAAASAAESSRSPLSLTCFTRSIISGDLGTSSAAVGGT
eukprot:CAMPEP_0197625564 /NCGR_PEP_ID=MMETSP1338-20131121/4899_1 /TAXON_ID=43686 ORGANISM="Pelagodinium beii, Strain RCC1491" /NCGR_SAMPLE_ID=MMETSP1338 /ASSEMBLY_ACC=CAM_ASM_000754 /LENGTH=95 /DNA_ID=CAMNT_0043196005 /DNA_START=160 /DNA_END=447 /DNA_ORIENTATION=+